jgi:hypothetical protein
MEKLVMILRESDVTSLEQIIKGKESSQSSSPSRRKRSDMISSFESQNVTQEEFNIEAKYSQAIELWNSLKFLVSVAIKYKILDLPIPKLLSLVLESFPFSPIEYEQNSIAVNRTRYEKLQGEINDMTGLKKEVLEIFQTLWEHSENKIINFLIWKGDPRLLIHGNVDPTAVIREVGNSECCAKILEYFGSNKFSLPKNAIHYRGEILKW